MAKKVAKKVTKKRVRKNVERGQAQKCCAKRKRLRRKMEET